MKVVAAVRRELSTLADRGDAAATSAAAATALELARQLDDDAVSASAKAACARELRECLALLPLKLLERPVPVAPETEETKKESPLDDLGRRRSARRSRTSGA